MAGPPVFNVGQVLTVDHVNEWLKGPLWVRKTADTETETDTSVNNDPHLVISVGANRRYYVEIFILFQAHTLNDMKFQLSVPTDAIFRGYAMRMQGGAADTGDMDLNFWDESTQLAVGGLGNDVDVPFFIRGMLSVDDTAGDLQVQWSQFASGGAPTIVRANSYIRMERVE